MKQKMFFAGSGGQGTLAIGQMLAKAAMDEGKEVTWLPSYGPEMRGGTANCTVVVADKPIACPLINEADLLVVMNLPSLLKFESLVAPGGLLIINSSLVPEKAKRDDIRVCYIPANDDAMAIGNDKAANMVMLGAIIRTSNVVSLDIMDKVLEKTMTGGKAKLIPANKTALSAWKE